MKTTIVFVLSILVCGSIIIAQEDLRQISVNSTVMDVKNDGLCTLIEAVISANTHSPSGNESGECPAGSDTTTIVLEGGKTYLLEQIFQTTQHGNNGLPIIDTDLVIRSSNNDKATIVRSSTADMFRMFEVSEGASLELENISIENGENEFGGAIYNNGSLLLQNVILTSNHTTEGGGAIYNNGSLDAFTIELRGNGTYLLYDNPIDQLNYKTKSVRSQAGGAIFNNEEAIAVIRDALFIENSAQAFGGGISNIGSIFIFDTAFQRNKAESGGGVFNLSLAEFHTIDFSDNEVLGRGGGIYNPDSVGIFNSEVMFIEDSTFRSNYAGFSGGAIATGTLLSISDSSFDNNIADGFGGGIHNTGTLILNGSRITNNTAWEGGGMLNVGTLYIDEDSNIINNEAENNGHDLYNPYNP